MAASGARITSRARYRPQLPAGGLIPGPVLRVKPGRTGYAQVNDIHDEVDTQEKADKRLRLDDHYIANRNLRLDIYVIIKPLIKSPTEDRR
jgi:lipopolysaccharide/colanic/teichoic acid biosynthesis glycosyltransferase